MGRSYSGSDTNQWLHNDKSKQHIRLYRYIREPPRVTATCAHLNFIVSTKTLFLHRALVAVPAEAAAVGRLEFELLSLLLLNCFICLKSLRSSTSSRSLAGLRFICTSTLFCFFA